MDGGGVNGSERLDSWKAIAAYLNRDHRTVQRWERERGLPIHRVPGGRGTSVFAYCHEIDAWLRTSAGAATQEAPPREKPARRGWYVWAGAATVTVLGAGAIAWWLTARRPASLDDLRIEVTEQGVAAVDRSAREVWRYRFPDDQRPAFDTFGTRLQLVRAPAPRVFAAVSSWARRSDDRASSGELIALTPAGHVERTFRFDDRATFDGKTYGPPWVMTGFAVDDHFGSGRIAVTAHHYQWSASTVTVLDRDFRRLGTYWQWGWVEGAAWIAPNRLLVTGFNDAKDGGELALLDPEHMTGQAPELPGTHGYCSTCGSIAVIKMVVMPRTEVNRITVSRFNRAVMQLMPDRVVARTIEVASAGAEAVDALYEYSLQLDPMSASFGGPYWQLHEALHARGQLDHDRAHCLDRDGPREILTWDRDRGWQSMSINTSTRPPATR